MDMNRHESPGACLAEALGRFVRIGFVFIRRFRSYGWDLMRMNTESPASCGKPQIVSLVPFV